MTIRPDAKRDAFIGQLIFLLVMTLSHPSSFEIKRKKNYEDEQFQNLSYFIVLKYFLLYKIEYELIFSMIFKNKPISTHERFNHFLGQKWKRVSQF